MEVFVYIIQTVKINVRFRDVFNVIKISKIEQCDRQLIIYIHNNYFLNFLFFTGINYKLFLVYLKEF